MASTINALSTGSGGLVSTGDASGQLELQANGSTKLTVSSSGVNMSGLAFPTTDGTNGQVLQTNGSGTLSFATPAGGSWTYLSTVTASNSATMDVETTIDSTYDTYAIILSGIVPQNDSQTLRARFKIGGSYATANYNCIQQEGTSGGWGGSTGTAAIEIITNAGNTSGLSCAATIYLHRPSSTSLRKLLYGTGEMLAGSGSAYISIFSGTNSSTSAVTGVQFYFGSGNVASGTARLYGIKNS